MPGADVLACVTAITSAFQTAAETLDVVKQRKEKKKWKREKDLQELYHIRWLHISLSDVSEVIFIWKNRRLLMLTLS